MTAPTDLELIDRWKDEPAPLLPLLHAIHDRDGCLTDESIRAVSHGLRIPVAELFGTVTFYHHFARGERVRQAPRVCDGPVCRLRGSQKLIRELRQEGAEPMPCAGRCDDPIPVLRGALTHSGTSSDSLAPRPSSLPPMNPGGVNECVFSAIRKPGRATLPGYRRTGGYEALLRSLAGNRRDEILEVVSKSGLAGRGGAAFPTGTKWRAVAEAPGAPKTIVCNADEGEPGCFKDRAIMAHDPHAVIEGILLAAYATGAQRGFIYLRYEYPEIQEILAHAIEEARCAGLLGENVCGSDFEFQLYIRRGAGAYICGEEGSLLNSLEGLHPFPRNRPPYPVTHGYENLPTAVNNVETLASVPPIVRHGADWYRGLGMNGHAGTKVISLSGDIERPGNYEVPIGLPLRTLLDDWAGGPGPNRSVQAVTMAGLSGGFLPGDELDVALDEESLRSRGSFLGAGGVMVFDDTRDMVAVAREAMEFFADESCGKCFPCRIGTRRLVERLEGRSGPAELRGWIDEVREIGRTMKAVSACGLGIAAPLVTESLLEHFPEQVARHVAVNRCRKMNYDE